MSNKSKIAITGYGYRKGGGRPEGRNQTPRSVRINNEINEQLPKRGFNKFVNEALAEKLERESNI